MKTSKIKFLALLLSLSIFAGALAACGGGSETETNASPESSETEVISTDKESDSTEIENTTDGEISSETATVESESESGTEKANESETESLPAETEEDTTPLLEGKDAELIELADRLANTVNSYFPDPSRSSFVMENKNVSILYDMESDGAKQVKSVATKSGNTYVSDTLDVFLRMNNGNVYYASSSQDDSTANIFRLGYYYYDNRIEGQNFVGDDLKIIAEKELSHMRVQRYNMTEKIASTESGTLRVKVTNNEDPWLSFDRVNFKASDYNALLLTMKTNDQFFGNMDLYIIAGDSQGFSTSQSSTFFVKTDGEYHTYLIPLSSINGYTGNVTGIRIDPNTYRGAIDGIFEIKELKAVKVTTDGAPDGPKISRHFGFYSDKVHQTLQVYTPRAVDGVDAIGFVTKINADTVSALKIKDKNGLHDSLEGVDFPSVEYVGFLIKGVGVYGYILPYDGEGGTISVYLNGGVYEIVQEKAPTDGKLIPSVKGDNNGNDFYMGHRLYTDTKQDFTAFLKAAEEERHPLGEENFIIDAEKSTYGKFVKYDSLRGIYTLKIDGVDGFNPHYLLHNNRQYNVTFTVKGDGRQIYVLAHYDGGALECAALLNGDGMLIPVPLEVGKNFADGSMSDFDLDDKRFSETILPMLAEADSATYSVVNMYHKWGAYLLKQISFITYFAPYYHLSTGIHESNCIIPYYWTKAGNSLNTLPDHRAMSSPVWDTDPQHTYCGNHFFLQYTDADGNYSATENTKDTVGSYGPIYADVTMDYISDDGKIKVSYNHMEMPQTDENRAYYEMKYEILEDISFTDFAKDFSFYSATANDPKGLYTKLGYLDKSNKSQVVTAAGRDEEKRYVLGDECPYVSFFDMPNYNDSRGYSNLSFLIGDYSFVIDGKKADPNFIVVNTYGTFSISLDLGEVTLKAGDSFTVHAIVMPWGSQESYYSGDAPDKNVRDVRENSLLKPATITPVANCEAVDTAFLPAVRTKDGKSAEFTISGGENNMAIRIYGFDMLAVPVVEEKIDDRWQTVKLCSAYTPDGMGYGYQYDGYMVYYDGDGTFSYAFVTTMKNGAPRTFRVTAAEEFDGWDEIVLEEDDPFYFGSDKLEYRAKQNPRFNDVTVMEEEGRSFVRFTGTTAEAYISLFADNTEVTGDLLVVRYRIPTGKPNKIASFNFFTSTTSSSASSADSYWAAGMAITDGEWQVLVVDLSAYGKEGFLPNGDGTYTAKYLRFDIFNDPMSPETLFDLEYIALCDDMSEVIEMNSDMEQLMLATKSDEYKYVSTKGDDTLNVHVTATQLFEKSKGYQRIKNVTLSPDGEYVTFAGSTSEATLLLFNENSTPTGQYMVLKYRIPENNPDQIGYWNFFTSTENSDPAASDAFYGEGDQIVADGDWHVVIFDLAARANETFSANANGEYVAKYMRFDVFNGAYGENTKYDVAYIGFSDSLDTILKINADMDEVVLSLDTTKSTHLDPKTGEEIKN